MQCPYCGSEMEAGRIKSKGAMWWMEGNKRDWLGLSYHSKRAIREISYMDVIEGGIIEAYRCAACKKILFDY